MTREDLPFACAEDCGIQNAGGSMPVWGPHCAGGGIPGATAHWGAAVVTRGFPEVPRDSPEEGIRT